MIYTREGQVGHIPHDRRRPGETVPDEQTQSRGLKELHENSTRRTCIMDRRMSASCTGET
jgi:hypothetical protein